MKFDIDAKITEVIELINNDTHEKEFLISVNNEWQKISQKEYKNILRGKKND